MERHLYKRTVKKDGKEVTAWYYWYYDENHKQVRKSCGQGGKMCLKKKDAESYLHQLEIQEIIDSQKPKKSNLTFKEIAEEIYKEDSTYLRLREARGRKITPRTLNMKRNILNRILIPYFGDRIPAEIDTAEVENFLLNLNYSNSHRNYILTIFMEVMKECARNKIITSLPMIEGFRRNSKRKDIFTLSELNKLFPEDIEELTEVWRPISNSCREFYLGIDGAYHKKSLMFAILFYTTLTTGMRSGEIRALCWEQIAANSIYVDRMIDSDGKLQFHLKKGTDDDPKKRTVLIPEKTIKYLELWKKIQPQNNTTKYVFTMNGTFLSKATIENRFDYALVNTGIFYTKRKLKSDGKKYITEIVRPRKLSIHSLRYTYNTLMVNSTFPQEVLRNMIGHESYKMTEHYTKYDKEIQIAGLLPYQQQINEIWK